MFVSSSFLQHFQLFQTCAYPQLRRADFLSFFFWNIPFVAKKIFWYRFAKSLIYYLFNSFTNQFQSHDKIQQQTTSNHTLKLFLNCRVGSDGS